MDCTKISNFIKTPSSKTTTSKNFTGFEIHQMSSGNKLCSMKFEETNDLLCSSAISLLPQQFKFAVGVEVFGFSYVTSLIA